MKVIGITGGVGCGKTSILTYIKEHCACRIIYSDELAKQMHVRGGVLYEPLIDLLGTKILREDLEIDRAKMAAKIFADPDLLAKVNALVHPAVTREILAQIAQAEKRGEIDFFFVEAALLIENGFDKICDELWYIYANESVRRKRLKESRGYSDQKIDEILRGQLSEQEFREVCDEVIDNSNSPEESFRQVDRLLAKKRPDQAPGI
ncbi:MAG: dephospho-CoA kinase [Lachnospiraceae bacterium]|nr:dephospho-CoA kinase [Lachnospiraceae bacterium]